MNKRKIPQRKRIYCAVEGEGEQAFIKFLQFQADNNGLHVHLDSEILNGGGYESMLVNADRLRSKRERYRATAILLVDSDRAEKKDDEWTLEKLRRETSKRKFSLCLQKPNLEGVLLRMLPNNERLQPTVTNVRGLLQKNWATYEKPANAQMLRNKFSLADLLRVAKLDEELESLLTLIGLLKKYRPNSVANDCE